MKENGRNRDVEEGRRERDLRIAEEVGRLSAMIDSQRAAEVDQADRRLLAISAERKAKFSSYADHPTDEERRLNLTVAAGMEIYISEKGIRGRFQS